MHPHLLGYNTGMHPQKLGYPIRWACITKPGVVVHSAFMVRNFPGFVKKTKNVATWVILSRDVYIPRWVILSRGVYITSRITHLGMYTSLQIITHFGAFCFVFVFE
jgi:hypothetical protein